MRGAFILLAIAGCTGEVEQQVGYFEPIRVPDGEFVEAEIAADKDGVAVTAVESGSGILTVGQRGRTLYGRAGEGAYAVAVRFTDLGTGWWVRPVGAVDPMYPGEREFIVHYDVGGAAPPGPATLLLAAVDADGNRGPASRLDVCVRDDRVPDNLNSCDPTIAPPALVIALQWDRDVDLDLIVETPGGQRISAKTPTSGAVDGAGVPQEVLDDPRTGRLTRDSNAACVADGRNSEAVVFMAAPDRGDYHVYADLFDACGEPAALFQLVVYRREQDGETFALVEVDRVAGTVLDLQAGGAAGPPLFVTSVEQP